MAALVLAFLTWSASQALAEPAPDAAAPTTPAPAEATPNPQPGSSPVPPDSPDPEPVPAPPDPGGPCAGDPAAAGCGPDGTGPADSPDSPDAPDGTTAPCTGQDCADEPAVPPPPDPQPTPDPPDTGGDGVAGWVIDGVTDAINAFFERLIESALGPLLDLLSRTLLTTPTLDQLPQASQLWTNSWQVTLAGYSILIMIGGITVMSYESVQTRTSIKEIAPRVPTGLLAAGLSHFLAGKAVDLANGLTLAVLGDGLDPATMSETLRELVLGSITGGGNAIFLLLLGTVVQVLLAALLAVYIARVAITVVLVGAAPLFLACHALPVTDGVARWWWKAFGAVLAIQLAQSLVLVAFLRVFLAPGGFTVLGPTPNGLVNLLVSATLVYILFKIPFWLFSSVRVGNGRSFLGRIVRAYVTGRALGLLGGRGGGRSGGRGGLGRGGGRGRHPRGGGPRGGPPDPYDRVEADPDGQLMLPLTRVPRVRRPGPARGVPRAPRPAPRPRSGPRHQQLTLPFGAAIGPGARWLPAEAGAWVDPDGQYLLPFDVDRVTPAVSGGPRRSGQGGRPGPSRPRGRQLELPFDPYKGARPDRTGQYALPLEGLRRAPRTTRAAVPRTAPPRRATPPPRPPAPPRARQLELPLDLPRPPRRPRPGGSST